jgi:hypothetical protein
MVMIHRLGKTTSGGGGSTSMGMSKNHSLAKNQGKLMGGTGLSHKIYEGGKLQRKSEVLRDLKLSKPSIPKKYISLEL